VWTAHDSAASSNTEIVKMTCQKRKKGNEEGERKEERGRRRERLIFLMPKPSLLLF